jgi:hypothetical protein
MGEAGVTVNISGLIGLQGNQIASKFESEVLKGDAPQQTCVSLSPFIYLGKVCLQSY